MSPPSLGRRVAHGAPPYLIMKTLTLLFALILSGCGVGATHSIEDITYKDGHTLHADYWIYTGTFLADPAIGEISRSTTGAWKIKSYSSKVDNEGLSAFVEGVANAVIHLFGAP